jgi:GNAT superfamily N-acetyltransferase
MGWLVPLECVVADQAVGTGVISVSPPLRQSLLRFISLCASPGECLPPGGQALTRFAREFLPTSYPKVHRILQCPATTFRRAPDVLPVSELPPDDLHADWYRLHFDGPVFVARNDMGSIVSWAAIKCKSDHVWEMAVSTDAAYRGRGLARSVVSHATHAALDAGKLPLYLHEISNTASARVCGALGYQPYGYELTCETGRVMPRR